MRPPFAKFIGLGGSVAVLFALTLAPARVSAQSAILDKTTYGRSQNDGRDLANSLVPGEKKFGKGEKKVEVNSAELKSKTVKDTTFGGSLLNMGIVGAEPKLDESKRPAIGTEKDSTRVKQPAATGKEPLLKLSDEALLQQQAEQSAIEGDKQPKGPNGNPAETGGSEKHQKTQSAAASETTTSHQSSTNSSEKPAKPDGDH